MLDREMKHKHTFALHSSLPTTFGSETQQAVKDSSILKWSWIYAILFKY